MYVYADWHSKYRMFGAHRARTDLFDDIEMIQVLIR